MVNPPRRILPLPHQIPLNLTLTQTLTLTQVGIHRGGGELTRGNFSVHQKLVLTQQNQLFRSVVR